MSELISRYQGVRLFVFSDDAAWCQQEKRPVLLDVREDWERERAALPNAHPVPLSRWQAALDALALPQNAEVVTFCHHGVRSLRAGEALVAAGFGRVHSMAGGIEAWAREVDAQVGRY